MTADGMPVHEFVDEGRLALAGPYESFGRPVCSWDEDGEGACDRPRDDPIHRATLARRSQAQPTKETP